ncbi:MAG TPA: zinc-dependent alcohol dehydrogenase family protein [Silvibacterium sp.]|nr:zinc-dependent alcohol dehydrogenase family protein [Silvibacterium sp.]
MARIVRFHKLGGPENLQIDELPLRPLNKGEVKLRVQALGLNRAESMFYHGMYLEEPKLPSGLGYEAAGVVTEVGPGVDPDWIGKTAATIPAFSMKEYGMLGDEVIAPVHALGEYPAKLTPVEGAAIWMQYVTAYGALIEFGKLTAGDHVVITAASSSVGLAAIQIVNDVGGVPIATTRGSAKRNELIELGAEHVIAADEEDLAAKVSEITGGKGARLIFDPIAGPFVEKLASTAAHGGIIFQYGWLSLEPTPFPLLPALSKALTLRGYTLWEITQHPELLEVAKEYVYDRLADGRFVPKIAKTFPFEQTVEAYKYLESNQQIGKVVITVP